MYLATVTTGSEKREFNGPVLLPIWNGADGFREGQIAYDADGTVDPDSGPSLIYWDGTQWLVIGSGDTSKWGTNDGFPDFPKIVPADGSVPATIVQVYDQYTRTTVTYSEAINKIGGSAITDADLGPIYIKDPATGKYYVRNWEGPVFPRWWGAVGDGVTNDTTALQNAINFAAPLSIAIDGEFKSYKITHIDMLEKMAFRRARIVMTAGNSGFKINEIGQAPTVYKRTLLLEDITFTGSCTYALIISTITGITLRNILFESVTATNDVFYFLNCYDSTVKRLTFTACTVGSGNACLYLPSGINGVDIENVYTSAFTDYGIKIEGGAATHISDPLIQGAVTGIFITSANGLTITNPYFENTVNPVVIDNSIAEPDGVQIRGGFWATPSPSHPQIAQNNGVMIKYTGTRNNITLFGGRFDVSPSTSKKLASVGASGVMNILRPGLTAGGTVELTDYLFKEATALSTAGYYAEYTVNANAYTTVRRTPDIANEHIVERFDSGANVLRSVWNPTNVGSAAATLTFYTERVSAVNTGSVTLNTGQDVVRFNTTSAPLTATLPVSNVPTGKVFVIKKSAGTNALTVTCFGGVVTIDGATSVVMNDVGETMFVQWDGAAYIIIARGSTSVSIANQFTVTQTGNFIISGRGAASNFKAVRADNASYQAYYGFGRDGIDDTKTIWEFGVTGVPIAGSGPSLNSGGSWSLRSYTVAGVLIRDVISSDRNGRVTIGNNLTVGTGSPTASGALTIVGNIGINGGITSTAELRHGSGLWQNGTITVTGDYTISASEQYINVNNSANCVITIIQANPSFPGRVLNIKKISNNAFTVTVVVAGGVQTIDGAASYVISAYNDPVFLHDDGSNWFTYTRVIPAAVTPTLQQVATAGSSYTGALTVGGLVNTGPVAGSLAVVSDTETLGNYLTAICNTASAAATVTLPTGLSTNRIYYVRRSSTANALTLNTSGSDVFNDGTTSMNVNNAVMVQLQGSTWWVLSSF